jgi:hypothetical protein
MSGLVIDILIAFLYKASIRGFDLMRSRKWKRKNAVITAFILQDPYLGCPSAKVEYQVCMTEPALQRSAEIAFYFHNSAKKYIESLSSNLAVIVRVSPGNNQEVLFFPYDQVNSSPVSPA